MKVSLKNEIFQAIFSHYEKDIESLYKEESACLSIFRIIPEICQQIIMRMIYIDTDLKLSITSLVSEVNWSDIFEEHTNDIRNCIRILFSIKILSGKEIFLLNQDFKKNMLKILKVGLTKNTNFHKKKSKGWQECFETGMAAFEKYLVSLYDIDNHTIETENDKIKFLVNSGFLKKGEANLYKLSAIALSTLLEDRHLQIRTLIIRYIVTNKNEDNNKNLKFLHFLFSISTLAVGAVLLYF
jgi:hypothetical protein